MLVDGIPRRTFRLDRLYFRYIKGTYLEHSHTVESFAEALESMGFIRIDRDRNRYAELDSLARFRTRDRFLEHFARLKKGGAE